MPSEIRPPVAFKFVRAVRDERGRLPWYTGAASGGQVSRREITEDGFIVMHGCACGSGDDFVSPKEIEEMIKEAKKS